jgi:HAD superfamily hydrolase (TIGR01549 family)
MFDWTGTLVDEYELDKNVCKNMELEISRKKGIALEEAKKRYADLLIRYENNWNWYNYPLHAKIFGIDWKKIQISELPKLKIIPHAIDVLSNYKKKGYHIFLLTNAVKAVIDLRIDFLEMRSFFDLIVTSDIVKATKSAGKHFKYALKLINVPKKYIYTIGDDLVQDIFPAKRLELTAIQCKFGSTVYYHTNNYNSNIKFSAGSPDFVIDNIEELLKIIKDS